MDEPTQRLAVVSDEAAPGFAEAVAICLPLGIRAYEIRSLYGSRVPFVPSEAVAEVIAQQRTHGLKLIGISPGFGKLPVDDPASAHEVTHGLEAAFRLMQRLDVRRMTTFSYRRTAPDHPIPDQVINMLGTITRRCQTEGVEMLIENSSSCWADTGANLAAVSAACGVRVTWDPANAQASGEQAYPTGYKSVRGRVAHVHLKNWLPDKGWVTIQEGLVDMAGQIGALVADGYEGYFCIESHQWADRARATRMNIQQLLDLLSIIEPRRSKQ